MSHQMPERRRSRAARTVALVAVAGCAAALAVNGTAYAASDPAVAPTFTRTTVDAALTGAAFVVSGDVTGDVRPELVASSFGPYRGPAPVGPGTVRLYSNAAKNKQGGDIDSWTTTTIVPGTAGIYGPNRPTLSDVDGDGDIDVIVPAGNFFKSFLSQAPAFAHVGSGTLTWWEQQANGATWIRHDIIADSTFTGPPTTQQTQTLPDGTVIVTVPSTTTRNYSFHGVEHVDLDNDGIRDLVTVGEDGGNPSGADDVVATLFLKGLGGGSFADPVKLAGLGGSIPVVNDVNADGKLDIVSSQFFGAVAAQPLFSPPFGSGFVPTAASSFIWLQQGDDGVAGLSAADFTARKIGAAQGPSFQIIPVPNFRGDGVTRWIGTNHTNKNVTSFPLSLYPEPAVYEFTPGVDPTQPWSVVKLTGTGAFTVTGGAGQAAPGGVGAGDIDGDGDLDLAVSGDGDRTVYTIEQRADGSFLQTALPDAIGYGQAGGAFIADLNRDGVGEIVFSSFDQSALSIWKR